MATDIGQIVEQLATTLSELEAQRDAEIDQVRLKYQEPIDQCQRALAAFRRDHGLDGRPHVSTLGSVGKDKVDAVLRYMRKHPRVRQADISKDTGLNTGAVSVALRHLEVQERVRPTDRKENGSRIWESVNCRAQRQPTQVAA